MQKIQKEYKNKGVSVVMISIDDERFMVPVYLKRNPALATVLLRDDKVQASFGVQGIPTTFIIDQRGVVRHRLEGFGTGKEREIRQMLDTLLAEMGNRTLSASSN